MRTWHAWVKRGSEALGRIGVAGVAVCAVVGLTAASASAMSFKLVGDAARLPAAARVVGALAPSTPLRATVALQPRDPSGLQALATAVSTPGSSQYGEFLTVPQFVARFGATALAMTAVENDLRGAGLRVGDVPANHLSIPVTGTAAQMEQAFSTSLAQVKLPTGRIAYANAEAPALPTSIAGYVQGVIGLDNLFPPMPQQLARVRHAQGVSRPALRPAVGSGPQPCAAASQLNSEANQYGGTGQAYTADQVASMYALNSFYAAGDEGAGQTIALVEEEPFQASDISTYQACYGLPTTPPNVINVDGGPGAYTSTQDDGEAALDIEQVIGLAPKAAIDVYQGQGLGENTATASDILSRIVSDDQAKVISSSYGICEALTDQSVINAENTLLQEAATQGQSFFISSGDSGAEMCYQATRDQMSPNFSLSVIDPGGQPFATAVGGTSLGSVVNNTWVLPDNGSYPSEFVWNDGVPGGQVGDQASGSGGGVSDQWPMPAYQSNAPASLDVINSNSSKACDNTFCREVPDVSADADLNSGYAVYANGGGNPSDGSPTGWQAVGGTSAAAPLWAAYTALMNASSTCRGLPLGFENPALYQVAGSSFLANFHDITQASPFTGDPDNNTLTGLEQDGVDPNDLYPVATGYDMATGLGTPIGNALGASLCSLRAPVYSVAVTNPGTQSTILGQAVSVPIHASDSGSATLSYSASGLPAGLGINPSTGVISGTPTTPGTSTVTVGATDQFTNAGSTQFSWTVIQPGPPGASSASIGGAASGKPRISFTATAGSNAPALTTLIVSLPAGLSFSHSSKSLKKGVVVKSGGRKVPFKVAVRGGRLVITLGTPLGRATVTIGPPALVESKSLAGKVRRGKVKRVTVGVTAVDASGLATALSLKLRV